jgi:hypothetical protein
MCKALKWAQMDKWLLKNTSTITMLELVEMVKPSQIVSKAINILEQE